MKIQDFASIAELGGYTVTEQLSSTHDAILLKGFHSSLGFPVLLKLYVKSETTTILARNELLFMRGLDHPYIAHALDSLETEDFIVIVLKYAKYCDLYNYIATHKLTMDICLSVMRCIISAVKYLHSKHIMHGDIKPENILIYEQNGKCFACLTDFEFTQRLVGKKKSFLLSGTPEYQAPEWASGHSFPSDIYALGKTFEFLFKYGEVQQTLAVEAMINEMTEFAEELRPDICKCSIWDEIACDYRSCSTLSSTDLYTWND